MNATVAVRQSGSPSPSSRDGGESKEEKLRSSHMHAFADPNYGKKDEKVNGRPWMKPGVADWCALARLRNCIRLPLHCSSSCCGAREKGEAKRT